VQRLLVGLLVLRPKVLAEIPVFGVMVDFMGPPTFRMPIDGCKVQPAARIVFGLLGAECQARNLLDRAREQAAHAVRLPARHRL
jgi:hypothetical protein